MSCFQDEQLCRSICLCVIHLWPLLIDVCCRKVCRCSGIRWAWTKCTSTVFGRRLRRQCPSFPRRHYAPHPHLHHLYLWCLTWWRRQHPHLAPSLYLHSLWSFSRRLVWLEFVSVLSLALHRGLRLSLLSLPLYASYFAILKFSYFCASIRPI